MTRDNNLINEYFDTEGAIFMGGKRNPKNCTVGIFGVPFDGTTSFRPGARFGPSAIREVSNAIETYCPQLKRDLEEIQFVDLGSAKIPYGAPEAVVKTVKKCTLELIDLNLKPLMLGGEHSITSGAISALSRKHPDLILIQLDAHADLRNEWLGSKYSHACAMRRCLDELPSKSLFQVSIRSGTREEFKEIYAANRYIPHTSGKPACEFMNVLKEYLGKPMYITIDLDWFDPSIVPGTGTPEPGGFTWKDFAAIVDVLKHHNLIGADIVELAPQLDPTGISSVLAAKVTRSLLMLLS